MLERAGQWLEDYAPDLTNVISLGLIAYVQLVLAINPPQGGMRQFVLSWLGMFFFGGLGLNVVGTYLNVRRTKGLRPLRERVETLQGIAENVVEHYYELCSHQLSDILRDELGYGDTERISMYRHRGRNAFQILGRYSENPNYNRFSRRIYPASEGVVRAAWESKKAVESDLPDHGTDPESYYEAQWENWGISKETAQKFGMKSRSYVAGALYEPKGYERVAVIVVESTKVGILDEKRIVVAIQGSGGERVYEFLEKMQSIEPNLEKTREEGF